MHWKDGEQPCTTDDMQWENYEQPLERVYGTQSWIQGKNWGLADFSLRFSVCTQEPSWCTKQGRGDQVSTAETGTRVL